MNHLRRMLSALALLASAVSAGATHLFGGEILYTHLSGSTYEIVIHLYLDTSSPADRPEIVLDPGDGTPPITVPRTQIIPIPGLAITKNIYPVIHTFPGSGIFTMAVLDNNRDEGLLNVPNSVSTPLCVEALLHIDPLLGANNSVHYTSYQTTGWYNAWGVYFHDPVPTEADGDSLVHELVAPLGTLCQVIPGYVEPSAVSGPGTSNAVDGSTGLYTWDQPNLQGYYTIAIRASEYRNGQLIGQVTRDMLLLVYPPFMSVNASDATEEIGLITTGNGRYELRGAMPGAELVVHDASGRSVLATPIITDRQLVDLSGQPSGVFLFRVVSAEGRRQVLRAVVVR